MWTNDAGKCTVLVSLDFSAAFDTINHNIYMGSPVLPLNGFSRTLNRETTRFVLETPFQKDGQ